MSARTIKCGLAAMALLFAGALPARAADKPPAIAFERIQKECVSTPAVAIGPGRTWTSCQLTRAGFVGTIGLLDFYYATYCLSAGGGRCDRVAQLVFSNRAYFPEATLQFHRIDPAGTRYLHAMMVGSQGQHAIATAARLPGRGEPDLRYHAWIGEGWVAVDAAQWRRTLTEELAKRLPEGRRAVLPARLMPEPERMALNVPLRDARDGSPAGQVEVTVRLDGARFAVGDVTASDSAH